VGWSGAFCVALSDFCFFPGFFGGAPAGLDEDSGAGS
jgi:hypothetical protein